MLWQTVPATEKARLLTVDSRVRRTDRQRQLGSGAEVSNVK